MRKSQCIAHLFILIPALYHQIFLSQSAESKDEGAGKPCICEQGYIEIDSIAPYGIIVVKFGSRQILWYVNHQINFAASYQFYCIWRFVLIGPVSNFGRDTCIPEEFAGSSRCVKLVTFLTERPGTVYQFDFRAGWSRRKQDALFRDPVTD